MELSLAKILLLALVIFVIFGGGKLPNAMRDLGKGIRNFKKGLSEDDETSSKKDSKESIEDKNS
jgi:sec-independent protein translocase protein TatA